MSTSPVPGRERSFSDPRDVDLFLETLGKFERGEIDAEAWRQFRLLNGTYGQRQDGDLHMQRVKIPQGSSPPPSSRRSPTSPSSTAAASATSRPARTSSSTS